MLAEAVEIIHGLWGTTPGAAPPADETVADPLTGLPTLPPLAYHGEHYRLDGAVVRTPPVQRPRVPVMIAGGGERVTLRQVARYADAANFGADGTPGAVQEVERVRRKLEILRQRCDDLGRPYD